MFSNCHHHDDAERVVIILDDHDKFMEQLLNSKYKQERNLSCYKQILKYLTNTRGLILKYYELPVILRRDRRFITEIAQTFEFYQQLPEEFKSDKQVMLNCFKKKVFNGSDIKSGYIPSNLMNDRKFILELIEGNPTCLYLVPKEREFVLAAMKHDIIYLGFLPGSEKKNESYMWELFLKNWENLRFASGELLNNPSFAIKVRKHDTNTFNYYCGRPHLAVHARDKFRNNREYVLFAILHGKADFTMIKKVFQADLEIKMANNIKTDASLWKLKEEWANDKEMILKYVKHNSNILKFINLELLQDYEFNIKLIYKNIESIQFINECNTNFKQLFTQSDKTELISRYLSNKKFNINSKIINPTNIRAFGSKINYIHFIEEYLNENDLIYITSNIDGQACYGLLNVISNKKIFNECLQLWKITVKKHYSCYELFNIKYTKQDIIEIISSMHESPFPFLAHIDRNVFSSESEVLLIAIQTHFKCFELASKELKSDLNFIRKSVNLNRNIIKVIDLQIVQDNLDLLIIYINYKLKINTMYGYQNSAHALNPLINILAKHLQNEDTVLQLVEIPQFVNLFYGHIDINLRSSEEFCLKILKTDLNNATKIPNLIKYRNFIIEFLKEGKSITFIPKIFEQDEEFLHLFFKNWNRTEYLPILPADEIFIGILIKELKINPSIYRNFNNSDPLKHNWDILLNVARDVNSCLVFPTTIWQDENFKLELVKRGIFPPSFLKHFNSILNDMDLIVENGFYLIQ
ncbi:predicted protein [Naegleria gruberi]|uniref:Predicted protein n=1 Tax=Naegleria gruberi TaxID=5762 RepID=D2V6V0_NAEGR|nr:uncharacterized protein NAEGRDRAFT_64565 [Naegleria gruberi]EFC47511.1 predicted protein [Naegleria gruberi]|eukprot:XP_002680255.1 predicted protein [Naegleria gruberi strain NEG-M]